MSCPYTKDQILWEQISPKPPVGGMAYDTIKLPKIREIYSLTRLSVDSYEELRPRSKCNSPHWAIEDSRMEGYGSSNATTPLATAQPSPSEQQEAIALKKALEWELSLDARELRSHAWYHGALPRQRAEEIVQREGDFLVRDCASQPDNYVLSCRSKAAVLHFVLNKVGSHCSWHWSTSLPSSI